MFRTLRRPYDLKPGRPWSFGFFSLGERQVFMQYLEPQWTMYDNHLYFSLNAGHFNWSLIYNCFLRVKAVTSAFPRRLCYIPCFMTKKHLPPSPSCRSCQVAAEEEGIQSPDNAASMFWSTHSVAASEHQAVSQRKIHWSIHWSPTKIGALGPGPIEPSAWGKTKVSWKRPSLQKRAG